MLEARVIHGWSVLALVCCVGGCGLSHQLWPPSTFAPPNSAPARQVFSVSSAPSPPPPVVDLAGLHTLKSQYAASRDPVLAFQLAQQAVQIAAQAQSAGQPSAELYYQAAAFSWILLCEGSPSEAHYDRAWDLYHASLAQLLLVAQATGQLSDCGLRIADCGFIARSIRNPQSAIPLSLYGFAWQAGDFQEIYPVGAYQTEILSRRHGQRGWGVPVVVRRCRPTGAYLEEPFLSGCATFAATVILRPDVEAMLADAPCPIVNASLEFYNPLRVSTVQVCGQAAPLAADISAPFAFHAVYHEPPNNTGLLSFLNPDRDVEEGLRFLEPYQPGKIPLVFVHGLLSSPVTWVDLANELRTMPDFTERFQIWSFRYATGGPFLTAAARLRRDLQDALATLDPQGRDAALCQMALIGHSMGGLVAKLQVVNSSDSLWRAVANRPFDQIVADAPTRQRLAEQFFFVPQPCVRRVIFTATPHEGSSWADRPLGKLGAWLAEPDAGQEQQHARLIAANPRAFSAEMQRGVPSSIELLSPQSPLLRAIRALPVAGPVAFHSVIGTGRPMPGEGPADGVVTVQSASHPGAASERFVPATHMMVHRHPQTVSEVARILEEHWRESPLCLESGR